ncbi:MAG: glutamate racemase [Bacteroidales bacterium]|jgi:glutamate racemase|nr:glutamate racemase [Bacteroidales bacterium]MCI1785127.1 glutamate racemase [Bacteroidales bacterium]
MIGIFDSGNGGLSVFREIYKLLPGAKYVYYGDNANCPYGEKEPSFIRKRAREITEFLIGKGAEIIVVACNTATGAAITDLRARYSDPDIPEVRKRVLELSGGRQDHILFIGMEPAIKQAVEESRNGSIGVLATEGTLNGAKYLDSKGKFGKNVTITEQVGQGWVELVEKGRFSGEEVSDTVKEGLMPLINKKVDTIVLGCTHYPFLMETIRKIAGPEVMIINPAPAVARHLIYMMVQEHILNEHDATEALKRLIMLSEMASEGKADTIPDEADKDANPDISLYSSDNGTALHHLFKIIFPGYSK